MQQKAFSIRLLLAASVAFGILSQEAVAQDRTALLKTWIGVQSRNVIDNTIATNPMHKLKLDEEKMYITLNRSPTEMQQPYTLEKDKIKGKYLTYTIESLTDSTLTLSLPNGLRLFFLAEGQSPCGDSLVIKIGDWNNRPYYKATSYLMPVLSGEPLFKQVENAIHFNRLSEKVSVQFSYIVDETGAIQDAKILRSYSPKVDALVLEILQESSGKWKAPIACGVPVATAFAQTFEFDPNIH
jgi:hypothetical protein